MQILLFFFTEYVVKSTAAAYRRGVSQYPQQKYIFSFKYARNDDKIISTAAACHRGAYSSRLWQ